MAALGANTTRKITPSGKAGCVQSLGVKASAVIYKGSALGDSSGAARALVAADAFMGFADESATGSGSDGGVTVRSVVEGFLVSSAITGMSGLDDIGTTVYMSSDNDLTATSSSNTAIGKVANYDAVNGFTVFFQAAHLRSI